MNYTEKVTAAIRSIPAGKVTSYGAIARAAGSPRAARQVVRVLHVLSDQAELPWHRVLNREGKIVMTGQGAKEQRALLEAEGVEVSDDGAVDLNRFYWEPAAPADEDLW